MRYLPVSSEILGDRLISTEQMKAARALLRWDQGDLAAKSGLSGPTIQRMEKRGLGRSSASNADLVQRTFEAAGIKFVDAGVTVRSSGSD